MDVRRRTDIWWRDLDMVEFIPLLNHPDGTQGLGLGGSTLFMVYGINSAIQHRVAMTMLLVGQYATSIILTQLYWISYSVHTPLSAALEWEYDPLLHDSITFSRESRLYGAPGGNVVRTNSFRRGTGYGTMNPVVEQDEEEAEMGPDEFLKVDLAIRHQRRNPQTSASNSAEAIEGDTSGQRRRGSTANGPDEDDASNSESSDEEQEMAVLLAFQDARRQQVFAFSPTASSSALPSHSVLSSSKDSDLIARNYCDPMFLSSYDRRMTAAEARMGPAASRVLTMGGHMAKRRSRATNADPQSIGRRTWTGGRSIIFSGILVESSDEDDEDDGDGSDGDAEGKEARKRRKQLAKLGFGTIDSTSSLSVNTMTETAETNDDYGSDHSDAEDEDHLGDWNPQPDQEQCEVAHGELPETDHVNTSIKVEVNVDLSMEDEGTNVDTIEGGGNSEVPADVQGETLELSTTQCQEGVTTEGDITVSIIEATSGSTQDAVGIVVDGTDSMLISEGETQRVAEDDNTIVRDQNEVFGVVQDDIPTTSTEAEICVDVESNVYVEEESGHAIDPTTVDISYDQGYDPLTVTTTEVVIPHDTMATRPGYGTVYEILPVTETFEAVYDDKDDTQTHVHGHGSVHMDITADVEIEVHDEVEAAAGGAEICPSNGSSEPVLYTETQMDESPLRTEEQHIAVDADMELQTETETCKVPHGAEGTQVIQESQSMDIDISVKVDVEENVSQSVTDDTCGDDHVLNDSTVAKDALTLTDPLPESDEEPRKNRIKVRVYETRETAMVICDDPNCPEPSHHLDHDVEIDPSLIIGNVTSGRIVQLDVQEFQRASVEKDGEEIEVDIDIDLKKELGLEGIPLLVSDKDGEAEITKECVEEGGKTGVHKRMRLKELVETTMIEEENDSDPSNLDPTAIKVDIDVDIENGKETGKLIVIGPDNLEKPPGKHGSTVVRVNERVETITVEEECIDGEDYDRVSVILPGDIPVKDGESVTIIRRPSRTSPLAPTDPAIRPPGRWMVTTDTILVRPPGRPPIPPSMVGPQPVMVRPVPGGFVRPIAAPRPMVVPTRPMIAHPRPMVVPPRPLVAAPRPMMIIPPRPMVRAPRPMVNAPRALVAAPRPMMVRPRPILVRPPQRVIAARPQAMIRPMLRPVPRPAPRVVAPAPVIARPQLRPVPRPVPVIPAPPPRPIVALRPAAVRAPPVVVAAPPAVMAAPRAVVAAPAPVMSMPAPTMMAQPPVMAVGQPAVMAMSEPAFMGAPPMMAAGPRGMATRSSAAMGAASNRMITYEASGPGAVRANGHGEVLQAGDRVENQGHQHTTAANTSVQESVGAHVDVHMRHANDGDEYIRSTDVDPDLELYLDKSRQEVLHGQHAGRAAYDSSEKPQQEDPPRTEDHEEEMEYLVQDLQAVPPQLRELSIETYYDTTKSQLHAREQQPIPVLGFQDPISAPVATTTTTAATATDASATTVTIDVDTKSTPEPIARTAVMTPPPVLSFPKPPSNPPPVKLLANRGAAAAVAAAAAAVSLKLEPKPALRTDHPLHASPTEDSHHAPGIEPREERRTTFQLPLPSKDSPSVAAATAEVDVRSGNKRPSSLARSLISQSILESGMSNNKNATTGGASSHDPNAATSMLLMPEVKLRPRTKDRKVKRPKSAMPMSRHHLHPSLLREGVMATWNNEFEAALAIFEDYKEIYPRWSLAAAEVHIVQQIFSGQLSAPDDQLNEALLLSEKVATKESNYMDYRSFCTADITLATTNESTLRQNYKWDCEMALYHTLLYRGILQITSASDTKGAFSDIKGGLQLRRAWKGYQRIKQEMALAKEKWHKLKGGQSDPKGHHDPLSAKSAAEQQSRPTTRTSAEPVEIPGASKPPGRSQSAKVKKPPPLSSSAKRASVLSTSQPTEGSPSSSAGSRWSVFGKRGSWNILASQAQDENEVPPEMPSPSPNVKRAGVTSALREQAKAAEDHRNAVEVLEDVEDTLTYGIGLFYFIISIIPKSFHPVLKTIGLQPDHNQGIQNLERVFERRNSQAPFAALFLMINYLFLPRGMADPSISLDRAGAILHRCLKSCPNGSCFLLMACHHARKMGNLIPTAFSHITRGIQTCEASGIPSINYRFEMGLTFFIDQQFSKAADIFEILWRRYLTSQQNQALMNSGMQNARGGQPERTMSFDKRTSGDSNVPMEDEYEEDEFELAPFCGLCLIACKVVMRMGQADYFEFGGRREGVQSHGGGGGSRNHRRRSSNSSNQPKLTPLSMATTSGGYEFDLMTAAQEVMEMMMEPQELAATVKTNASTMTTQGGKSKLNKFNKFAWIQCRKALERGRVSPFLPLIILYLRRDVAYMKPPLLRKFQSLLESALKSVPQPPDADSQAIYLLLNGVVHRELLPDDPTIAYTSFTDCLLLDSLIENETWVIPFCHYELGELLYKRLHLLQEAKDQFNWILKGPGKGPRSSIYASTATNPRLSMMGQGGPSSFQDTILSHGDPPTMGHVSQPSVASLASNPRFSQLFVNIAPTSTTAQSFQTPQALYLARYKKFEFSQSLRQRCIVSIEQLDKKLQQQQ
ncbi:hypothetical protein BGW41_007557 [Actinomortierella wolfii]|nr:hypothetical protein BGW41_007557 [Actinomortierella wolfii]